MSDSQPPGPTHPTGLSLQPLLDYAELLKSLGASPGEAVRRLIAEKGLTPELAMEIRIRVFDPPEKIRRRSARRAMVACGAVLVVLVGLALGAILRANNLPGGDILLACFGTIAVGVFAGLVVFIRVYMHLHPVLDDDSELDKDPFGELEEHARALKLAGVTRQEAAVRLAAEKGHSAESVEAAVTRVFGPPPPSGPPPPPAPSDPNASWPWKA